MAGTNGTAWSAPAARRWPPANNAARDRAISRLACLKAAAEFSAMRPEIKSADVVTIAARWLVWVEKSG